MRGKKSRFGGQKRGPHWWPGKVSTSCSSCQSGIAGPALPGEDPCDSLLRRTGVVPVLCDLLLVWRLWQGCVLACHKQFEAAVNGNAGAIANEASQQRASYPVGALTEPPLPWLLLSLLCR